MKNNKNFLKKYAKFHPEMFFDFNESDDDTLKKCLLGLRISINGNEIQIDDESKAKYVLEEIRSNAANYKLVHGVYRNDTKTNTKPLINQLAENAFR